MRNYEALMMAMPILVGVRIALVMIRRQRRVTNKVSTEKAADLTESLGRKNKPFPLLVTYRDEQLQPIYKQVVVSSVEGQYAPEAKGWVISHLMVRPTPDAEPEALNFWRLWSVEDPDTGEVVDGEDIHAYLLQRAGLDPIPYPFIFEAFESKVPRQGVTIVYASAPGRPPRTIKGAIIHILCRNSNVEKVVISSQAGGTEKRTNLLNGKTVILSLVPDGQEESVENGWDWLLRLGREWRSLDDRESSGDAAFQPEANNAAREEQPIF